MALRPWSVFFVGSDRQLQLLVGWKGRGWASGQERVVVVVTNDTLPPQLRHELSHVLTFQAWGRPAEPSAWLTEGIATTTESSCAGHEIRAVSKRLLIAGVLPPIQTVTKQFRSLPLGIAYVAAGSFMEYLEYRVAPDIAPRLWRAGSDSLPALTRLTWKQLEDGWHEYLRKATRTAPEAVLASLRGRACA
jgi:hypothetical protein